jgi:hypothetical protein
VHGVAQQLHVFVPGLVQLIEISLPAHTWHAVSP